MFFETPRADWYTSGSAHICVRTAGALLSGEDDLRQRHALLQSRVASLGERIDRVGRQLQRRCPRPEDVTPRLWLPPEARVPAEGLVAIFVAVGAPDQVVWADGRPRAASGSDGWAVLVTDPGPVSLCIAPPAAVECRARSEVYAAMGAAFEP